MYGVGAWAVVGVGVVESVDSCCCVVGVVPVEGITRSLGSEVVC